MEGQVLEIVKGELIPLIGEGVAAGFMLGTVSAFLVWGAFKAISLLNIKNY